jgi:hypothetical protein
MMPTVEGFQEQNGYKLFIRLRILLCTSCTDISRTLTLREEHRLGVSENTALRRMFGLKREEDGSWRKLHNGQLHSLYSSADIVSMIKSRRME